MADTTGSPIFSLDQQPGSKGNSISEAIRANYGTKPNVFQVITNPTQALSRRSPITELKMPQKICGGIDFLTATNDLNLDKSIKSLSLDPIIKRLIQEKNDIIRAIEGWVASQCNDGARQPALAVTIVKWIKKAIDYMRCGMQLVRKINELVIGMISSILVLIASIQQMIQDNINAINSLMTQFQQLDEELKKEGITLASTAILNATQDFMALFNEIQSVEQELLALKEVYSKDHLKAMQEMLINSFLGLIDQFKRRVGNGQRLDYTVSQLKDAVVALQATLDSVNALDLSIPVNPGGINAGALSNFSVTNAPVVFPDHDSLTKSTLLEKWDLGKPEQSEFNAYSMPWMDIFKSNESGYLTVSLNTFGLFQVGLDFNTPALCPTGSIVVRMVINGGDWVIQAVTKGRQYEDQDDKSIDEYSTRNGVFTKVPQAPSPADKIRTNFDEFIRAANRPANLITGASIFDPTLGTNVVVPEKDLDYVLVDAITVPNVTALTLAEWTVINNGLYRWPTQDEIHFFENEYTGILQTLNISPKLYVNPIEFDENDPILREQTLDIIVYTSVDTGDVIRSYRMPHDNQLQAALYGKRPFSGISIFTKSISFQICRQAALLTDLPYFTYSGDSNKDAHVVNFGLKADWGFAPISLLS